MKRGCVIGYDINEKGCQISYYDDSMEEPDTMMASSNNYHSSFLFLLYLFIKFEHFFCKYILFFILHHSLVTVCRCHLDHGVDSSETPS